MKKNSKTNRYQFLQKEETWIITALVEIEKTKKPAADEMAVIDLMNKSMLIEESDPYTDTFETFARIAQKYDIEGIPSGMTGFTTNAPFSHYTGPGDGKYFNTFKNGKDGFEKKKSDRQKNRVRALEKAAGAYDDPDDILATVAYINRIKELEARIIVLEAQSTPTTDDALCHSFDNLEQFAEAPMSKMAILRQNLKKRNAYDREFYNNYMRAH